MTPEQRAAEFLKLPPMAQTPQWLARQFRLVEQEAMLRLSRDLCKVLAEK